MSAFKGTSTQEVDPTWMVLHFHTLDDAITVVCLLLPLFLSEGGTSEWYSHTIDEDLRVELMDLIQSLLETFIPNGIIAQRELKCDRPLAANHNLISQLYGICCRCILT
jgi:hypothetical protein